MQKLRKPLSILLSLVMIFSVFTIIPVTTANAAESGWHTVVLNDIHDGDTVIITMMTGAGNIYGLPNASSISTNPGAVAFTSMSTTDGQQEKLIGSEEDLASCTWIVGRGEDGKLTFSTESGDWLYSDISYSDSGNTLVRVGKSENSGASNFADLTYFTIENGYLKSYYGKYLGVYPDRQDWRCYYPTSMDNIRDQYVQFWMYSDDIGTYVPSVEEEPEASQWVEVSVDDIADGDEVIFTSTKNGTTAYGLSNAAINKNPFAYTFTVVGSEPKALAVDDEEYFLSCTWTVGRDNDGNLTFTNSSSGDKLFCNNRNDGVGVGTGDNTAFTVSENHLYNTATSRYLGVYETNSDWRCYTTSTSTNINGQTLQFWKYDRCADGHSVDDLTHCAAVVPTYDPDTNTYTSGVREHYDCPECGGHFVLGDGQLVSKTDDELNLPYFVFWKMPSVQGVCYLMEYNGADADVIIPDTVPDDYPDSSIRCETVTGIFDTVFKDKTFITSVTIGDNPYGIFESAFEGCTGLTTVTVGSGLTRIEKDAFKGCTALESFSSTSVNDILFDHYTTDDPADSEQSFDIGNNVVFHGPHGSGLLNIADYYETTFIPTDRHTVAWTWSEDHSSATATLICTGCQRVGEEYPATVTQDGGYPKATVTIDGETYTETVDSVVARIGTDRYYASVADALPYAYVNNAVIILLNDASFQYTNELCERYPTYKLKDNGHTYNYGDPLDCYALSISLPDENGVVTYSAVSHHQSSGAKYYILEEEADNYTVVSHDTCPRCHFETVTRTAAEKHAAVAPTCTEAGNIEYYSYPDTDYGSSVTAYFALKAPDDADHENELEFLSRDNNDDIVTIPANGHNMTAHPAAEPMLIAEGNSAYWSCDGCGKYFSDANGEHEIAENSWILPGTATLVPTSYIDENGEEQTVGAIVLNGDEAELYHSTSSGFYFYTALGDASDMPIWYVVNQDVSFYHDESFRRNIELTGDVRFIVSDGATLTVQGEIKDGSLSVYGQTNGTGKVVANKIDYCGSLNVCSGGLTVATNVSCNDLAIYSGTTNITGAVEVNEGTVTLGCRRDSDSITFGSLTKDYDATASIVQGQTLTDGERNYSGNLSGSDLSAMAGKTLVKAHEHIAADMDYHNAISARYNAETGSYINGCKEYYYCPICRGYFVEDGGSLVPTTAEELLLPYFVLVKMPSFSACYLRQYNGADENVIIPDTVPESLASQGTPAGTPITHIDNNVFANHTELKTVTTGTGLCRIGAGAFAGCTALKDFTSTATQKVNYEHDESDVSRDSFASVTDLSIHATHASELFSTVQDYGFTFDVTDRHDDPTWTWAQDYSSATAHFDCEHCPYQDDITANAVVTQDGDLTVHTVTVTTPDDYTYTDTRDGTTKFVHYINEDGEDAVVEAKLIAGNETYLGTAGKESWYVVEGNISFNNADLQLNGTVNLILSDGASLTGLGEISSVDGDNPSRLNIFGQTQQTGSMEADALDDLYAIVMCGGSLQTDELNTYSLTLLIRGTISTETINAGSVIVLDGAITVSGAIIAEYMVSVASGSLSADSITAQKTSVLGGSLTAGDVTATELVQFSGGITSITGTVQSESVKLSCSSSTDRITVGEYQFTDENGEFKVVTGTLVDGRRTYSGTLTHNAPGEDDASHMAGRTLMLPHEHSTDTLTRRSATNPTYDPTTGEYANGNIEYWYCTTCDGCLAENETTHEYNYIDPSDTLVPYFTIQAYQLAGIDTVYYSEIAGYNGTDTDIVIPDTVPDNYPDSSQRGRTILSVGSEAFKNDSSIESVTMGDELRIISADAFRSCTALRNVTVGEHLSQIASGAFLDCSALESFTSTSESSILYYYNLASDDSFDTNSGITFYGLHGSRILDIANDFEDSFVPLDSHADPTWTWAADCSSATATFACSGCQLTAPNNTVTDNSPEVDYGVAAATYTATVTVDGQTFSDSVTVSYWTQLQNAINAAEDNTETTITLAHDCVASGEETALIIPEGKIIILDLNGYTIDRDLSNGSAAENGNVLSNNGTLTIRDSSQTQTGIITGGNLISGSGDTGDGGGIRTAGTLTLLSGTISGNTAALSGGGVRVLTGGTFNMSGGAIKDNLALGYHGGGVYNGGTMNFTGGTITGNEARDGRSGGGQGGGLLNNGTLNVSGSPVVKDNTGVKGNNIYLRKQDTPKIIHITGLLTDGAELGVYTETAPTAGTPLVFTDGLSGNGTADSFTSDRAEFYAGLNEGEAALLKYYVLSFAAGDGSGTMEPIKSKTNEIELPACTFTAPAGKGFKAWNVGGTEQQPGETATISSGYAMTVTAVWADAYHIEIEDDIEHGTVTPDAEYAVENQTVTLTVTPDEGYVLQELYVIATGTNPTVLNPNSSPLSFAMPAQDVEIHAYFAKGTAYVDAKGNDMPAKIAQELTYADTTWDASNAPGVTTSWYYAEGNVTIPERVTVTNNVNLILCDGATLTIPKGINVAKGTSLTIWQQKGGTGHLVINGVETKKAGIGSDWSGSGNMKDRIAGTITVNGGILDVKGGSDAAGIGGGGYSAGGTITINSGTVNVTSGSSGAAIGGGLYGTAGTITINGGTVNATGYTNGSAIGRGANMSNALADTVTINGGAVRAVMYYTSDYAAMNGSTFTLNYTDESKYTMSVIAESWSGTVQLSKKFVDEDGTLYPTQTVSDNTILNEKTLRPSFDRIAYHSLSLNGDIGVNFYLDLSEAEISQGAVVDFKLNGEDLSSYTVSSTDRYTIDGKTFYKATCRVCAPEMADTITATLSIGGEEVATEDYSVKTYGDTFLSDEYKTTFLEKGYTLEEYNKIATLVKTMLNYGAYTQIQFSEENAGSNPQNNTTHDAANLANADINYALSPLTVNEINAIEMPAPNKEAMNAQLSGTGLTYYGYTMLLHSETKLRFYFIKDSKNTDISDIHLSRNGITYNAQNYNAKYAFVEVPAIPAYELNYEYTLTVGEENLGSYSALTYVKDVLENSPNDTTLCNTVTAMYRYHEAAVAWFGNNSNS